MDRAGQVVVGREDLLRGAGEVVSEGRSVLLSGPSGALELGGGPMADETLTPLVTDRAGRALPRSAAAEICRATEGNLLFALEIASALSRRRAPPPAGEPVPVPVPVPVAEALLLTGDVPKPAGSWPKAWPLRATSRPPRTATPPNCSGDLDRVDALIMAAEGHLAGRLLSVALL